MKTKTDLLLVSVIWISIALFFRSLLSHFGSSLIDWFDYPYYVWTLYQNIYHFSTLQFGNFFTTNAFYPLEGTLLFSDLLLPQSIIAWVFYQFSSNLIFVFNLTFMFTLLLDGIAIYYFWGKLFKQKSLILIASIILVFSPFFFSQLSHFQMLSYWPLFFALGLVLENKNSLLRSILIGSLLIVQFLASVYLFIFLFSMCIIWYVLNPQNLKYYFLTLLFFAVGAFPFIKSYVQVRNAYQMTRDYGEYITYSAHLTDYIFIPQHSVFSTSILGKKWNRYNHHIVGERAVGFGILLSILLLGGIFSYKKRKQLYSISFIASKPNLFFLTTLLAGFLFSLGPRLSVNGSYTEIPLPYALLLKFVPFFEPIRATSRWSFLFYVGTIYFAVLGLRKISKKFSFKVTLVIYLFTLVIFTLETIPIKTKFENRLSSTVYQKITKLCHSGLQVLLEYPLNQTVKSANVATNLSYKTAQLLASTSHQCKLINGYAGYDPREYQYFENQLSQAVKTKDKTNFFETIRKQGATIIKLNKNDLNTKSAIIIDKWLKTNSQLEILFEDEEYLLAKIVNK